jgi:hypothetical protein
MGSAVDNLLLNLKLQLLALPSLARWGLLAFAGIIVLREIIDIGWGLYQGGTAGSGTDPLVEVAVAQDISRAAPAGQAPTARALPAPDPLAQPSAPARETVSVPMPGRGSRSGS